MTESESEKKIKSLEAKIALYDGLPTAKFYLAVMKGLEYITTELNNKHLDFESDAFAKSVFMLAKESDKVMNAMGKGVAVFQEQEEERVSKKQQKSDTKAV